MACTIRAFTTGAPRANGRLETIVGIALIRHRLRPNTARVRQLLESLAEVEAIDEEALPPAFLAAQAAAALGRAAPSFEAGRVVLAVRGLAHAHLETRIAGLTAASPTLATARMMVRQRSGPVLELEARGRAVSPGVAGRHEPPARLTAFARSLGVPTERYERMTAWPTEFLVALAAAGVEAEEDGLARLLRLTVDLVGPASLDRSLRFAIDAVRPISGDMARVIFHITSGLGRLAARGDALVLSTLAHSDAIALPARAA